MQQGHLFELYNVWVYESLVIEDLALHIFGYLEDRNLHDSRTQALKVVNEASLTFGPHTSG